MTEEKHSIQQKGFSVNDGRWWLREDDNCENEQGDFRLKPPTVVESLENRLAEKDKLLKEYIQAHKSSLTGLEEAKERVEKELDKRLQIEKAKMVEQFLEISDNLRRLQEASVCENAIGELHKGIELIIKQIEDGFQKAGLLKIPTQGVSFDPKLMEALMTSEVKAEQDGMVLEEVRVGYALGEYVVRPAGVRVGVSRTDK